VPRKRPNRQELLDTKLSELAALIKDISPHARVEISRAQYEDEDAHIDVYTSFPMNTEEVRQLETTLGERCNGILLETGLFIIGAVRD
jgi:hypothetical protein